MMKQRITLIGGGGYLGVNIISKLQSNPEYAENYEICVVDYQLQQFKGIDVDRKNIVFIEGSFLDEQILNNALKNTEVVFHIAAVGIMGISGNDKKLIQKVNVDGTQFLLEKCRQFNVKRFVFASSIAVTFVGKPFHDLKEDAQLPAEDELLNYYSVSKSRAETLVRKAASDTLKTCALRFRAIYGPGDPNATERVVTMIKSGIFICMTTTHEKEAESQASSINNCSTSFLLADKMLKKHDSPNGEAYYILDEEKMGSYAFWGPLIDALGFSRPTIFLPYKLIYYITYIQQIVSCQILGLSPMLTTSELKLLAYDNTYSIEKAKKDLGYVPEKGMMQEVVEYYKHQRITDHPHRKYLFSIISGFVLTTFSLIYLVR